MRYREFRILTELKVSVNDVIKSLEKSGFNDVKKVSGKKVIVFVQGGRENRLKARDKLLTIYKGSKKDVSDASSVKPVIHPNGTKINVKSADQQGLNAAGLKNEQHLIQKINQFIKEVGPLDITFVGDNKKSLTATGVTEARDVGKDVKGRKKSDVNLMSEGKVIPISIKSRKADYWESADTLLGPTADKIITHLKNKKLVTLTPIDAVTPQDNTKRGGTPKGTQKVKISPADVIIKAVEDIPDRMQPYLHIRNSPDRNRGLYPGTKVQASYFRRTAGLLIVDQQMNVVQMAKPRRQKAQPVPKPQAQVKPDQPQTQEPVQQPTPEPTPTQNKTAVQPTPTV